MDQKLSLPSLQNRPGDPSGSSDAAQKADGGRLAMLRAGSLRLINLNEPADVQEWPVSKTLTRVAFTADGSQLSTNLGTFPAGDLPSAGYGVSEDAKWLTKDGMNRLWLPVDYRNAGPLLQEDRTFAFGLNLGEVDVLQML